MSANLPSHAAAKAPASAQELDPAVQAKKPDLALQAQDLTRHYRVSQGFLKPRATLGALNGVSFALPPGRTLAVVGESGSGKSTLARLLTLAEAPTTGQLWLAGQATQGFEAWPRARQLAQRKRVQMVFQNPYASLNPRRSVAATLAEPLLLHTRMSASERQAQVLAALARVGLQPEHAARYPHMFSGGQRQRIAVARAMMLAPAVVVADEPTSALDVSIQAQILNLFVDLQEATGTAYVFISHNLSVVRHMAHEVLVMLLGRAVEQGPRRAVLDEPLHPYTRALLAAAPRLHVAPGPSTGAAVAPAGAHATLVKGEPASPLHPPKGCAFASRCPQAKPRCQEEAPLLRSVSGRQVACHEV